MIDERDSPEDVGGQALLSVLLLEGLLPEGRGELEDAALRPGLQEAQEVAEVGPGLDAVELGSDEGARTRSTTCSIDCFESKASTASWKSSASRTTPR